MTKTTMLKYLTDNFVGKQNIRVVRFPYGATRVAAQIRDHF